MYDNDEIDEEESVNQSFLSNFYNTNKKLIWIVLIVLLIILLLTVFANLKTNTEQPAEENVKILLTHQGAETKELHIAKGYAIKLDANIEGKKNVVFVWESSDTEVATVEYGLVKGINLGTTKITVKYKKDDGTDESESCDVIVTEGDPNIVVEKIYFPDGDLIMGINSQYNLALTISPSRGYINNRKYTSSDESVVMVDENGKVESLRAGNATITANINNGAFTTSINVYVLENVYKNEIVVRADNVQFASAVEKIKIGESSRLIYDVSPIDANLDTLTWKSSNEKCVFVDNNGNIKGLELGSSIISVYDIAGKEIGTVTVEVENNIIEVDSIIMPTTSLTMNYFTQQQIIPIVKPDDASNKSLEYISSDPTIVMVVPQNNGLTATLFALKKGTVTIEIKSKNGKSAYLLVNVVNSNNDSNDNGSNNGNNGGGNTTSNQGYTISSRDSEHPNTGWMNTGISGAQKEGATAPLTVSFSIKNSSTTKLKVCAYSYGGSGCDVNSGTTITSSGSITLKQKGYWVVKVIEYSGDNVRRGPDYWYAQIAKGSNESNTPANSDYTDVKNCSNGLVLNSKEKCSVPSGMQCKTTQNGSWITTSIGCNASSGSTCYALICESTTAPISSSQIKCYYISGNVCKQGIYNAATCGLAGYALYSNEEECNKHLPTNYKSDPYISCKSMGISLSNKTQDEVSCKANVSGTFEFKINNTNIIKWDFYPNLKTISDENVPANQYSSFDFNKVDNTTGKSTTIDVKFIPNDTDNYTTITKSISVNT